MTVDNAVWIVTDDSPVPDWRVFGGESGLALVGAFRTRAAALLYLTENCVYGPGDLENLSWYVPHEKYMEGIGKDTDGDAACFHVVLESIDK